MDIGQGVNRRAWAGINILRCCLYYAVVFFAIALIAALFGFGGIAAGTAEIAKILAFNVPMRALDSVVSGLVRRGR